MDKLKHTNWSDLRSKWLHLDLKYKVFYLALFLVSGLMSFLLLLYLLVGWEFIVDMPSESEIRNASRPVASKIYDRDNELIGSYYIQNRDYLRKEQINDFFKKALISTEDHRFYDHSGVDFISLFRVAVKTILLQNEGSGGGSTLTQQLVKNMFPRRSYAFMSLLLNKFREMHIAKDLERLYSKEEIIWMYCSTVSFGEQAFGLRTASQRFFNKEPEDLLLEESALLVGLLKATSYYSPRKFPERAFERRNLVLTQMQRHGHISKEVVDRLKDNPLILDYRSPSESNEFARYFKRYLLKEFKELTYDIRKEDGSNYDLYKDGLKVYTSLDRSLQIEAEKIMQDHMRKLQSSFERSWASGQMYGKNNEIIDDNIRKNQKYQALRNAGLDSKEALDSFNIEKEYKLWTWDGMESKLTTRIDSMKHYLKLLHASMVAADPEDGRILAYIGGNDYSNFQFDNVIAKRQVGSLFKPIAYLTALEQGKKPCDYYKNELKSYSEYEDWTPRNADDAYGGYLSMNEAFAHSVNTISVQIMFEAGINNVISTAGKLGIESELDPVPSLVLGTSDISLFEMLTAYARISSSSRKVELNAIQRIEDQFGNLIFSRDSFPEFEELNIDAESIKMLQAMMFKVSTDGTAASLYRNYRIHTPVISKTGTTQNQSDGWYIASSKDLIIGAWVGTDDRRMHFPSLASGSASRTALPLVAPLFDLAADNRILKENLEIEHGFECPDHLSESQHAYYVEAERLDSLSHHEEANYGGWLKNMFSRRKKKKRLNDRYSEHQIKQEIEKLKEERRLRLGEIDLQIMEWEKRLHEIELDQ